MWAFFSALISILLATTARSANSRPLNSVSMKIENQAGQAIDLYWINTFKTEQDYVLQNQKPIRNGTSSNIYSYDTHAFIAEFHDPTDDLKGVNVVFTKGPQDETVYIDYDHETLKMTATLKSKRDLVEDKVKAEIHFCKQRLGISEIDSTRITSTQVEELSTCMTNYFVDELEKVHESKRQLRESRDKISYKLRNYTCADIDVNGSPSIEQYEFNHNGHTAQIHTLLNKPAAKIWVAHNFVTEDECKVLVEHGRPRLTRATVAAEDGSSVVSENRKAQQAAYMMDNPSEDDPLRSLYDRVFAMANHHAGYQLSWPGQEGFTIIQYNPSDQYTPHCDGACDGSAHKSHGRVATAVLYCIVPPPGGGGATTFTNSDIVVVPEVGSAAFFSYKDMESGLMDEGDTEHSGCPVLKGEKWITTVWMREGVSSEPGESWLHFDPDGERMLDGSKPEYGIDDTQVKAQSSSVMTRGTDSATDEL